MKNDLTLQSAFYMLRHYCLFNVTDPLSEASRGATNFTSYFSGDNTAGQVNYLERKMATNALMTVQVGGVTKTLNSDYTYSNTTGELTWTGYTPGVGTDNISVNYWAIKSWVFDDNPATDTTAYPRISLLDAGMEHGDSGEGIYTAYYSGPGQYITRRVKYIVRDRRNAHSETFTYGGQHLRNYELVLAIAQNIEDDIQTHIVPPRWKFHHVHINRSERIYSEEDVDGIIRHDITVDVGYYQGNK
jgi:hypothetical protein